MSDGPRLDLLAYGIAESAAALAAKDRDQYQFWQGWCAALERLVPPVVSDEERDSLPEPLDHKDMP